MEKLRVNDCVGWSYTGVIKDMGPVRCSINGEVDRLMLVATPYEDIWVEEHKLTKISPPIELYVAPDGSC